MQMCMDHWNGLKAKIHEKGLDSLKAADGPEAIDRMIREANEGPNIDSFEPLMGAHNAILSNSLDILGVEALGDGCFLCKLNERHKLACQEADCKVTFDSWLEYAAQEQLEIWKELTNNE